MGWAQKFWYLITALIIANVAAGGYVFAKISEMMVSPEAEPLREAAICTVGVIILPPVVQVFGIWIFLPAISDVVLALAVTLIIVTILRIVGFKLTPWHTLGLGIAFWFGIKIFALFLVWWAGDACMSFVFNDANRIMNPLAMVGSAATPLILIKTIMWRIGLRGVTK